jgi:hypothetical protein
MKLVTGWEPEVAVGDSMLRRFLENLMAQNEAIVRAAGGWFHRDDDVAISDAERPLAYYNAAVPTRPPADWRSLVERLAIAFGPGSGKVYLWSAWPTPDLSEYGWVEEGHPPFLLRPPGPHNLGNGSTEVQRVVDDETFRQWERLAIEGYPLAQSIDAEPGSVFGPSLLTDERFRFFMAREAGRPASIAAQFVDAGMASFVLGVTLPEYRHRGHWQALVAARLDTAPGIPSCGVFSDHSRPGAERAGFLPIQRLTLWSFDRS